MTGITTFLPVAARDDGAAPADAVFKVERNALREGRVRPDVLGSGPRTRSDCTSARIGKERSRRLKRVRARRRDGPARGERRGRSLGCRACAACARATRSVARRATTDARLRSADAGGGRHRLGPWAASAMHAALAQPHRAGPAHQPAPGQTSAALRTCRSTARCSRRSSPQTLAADLGIEIEFFETTTICIERAGGVGRACSGSGQPPNRYLATVGLCVEPAPRRRRSRGDTRRRPRDDPALHLLRPSTRSGTRCATTSARRFNAACRDGRVPDCRVTLTECATTRRRRARGTSASSTDGRAADGIARCGHGQCASRSTASGSTHLQTALSGLAAAPGTPLRADPDPPAMHGRVAARSAAIPCRGVQRAAAAPPGADQR